MLLCGAGGFAYAFADLESYSMPWEAEPL